MDGQADNNSSPLVIVAEGDPNAGSYGISRVTFDRIMENKKDGASMLALYNFYCYTARWQNSNPVKSTTSYTAQGLGWGTNKVIRIKKLLEALGLVRDHKTTEGGKVTGWFVKVNYLIKTTLTVSPGVVKSQTNALELVSPNALELVKREKESDNKSEEPSVNRLHQYAEQIYSTYPRKVGKPFALRAISKAIKKFGYEHVASKAQEYVLARRGQDPRFTPHPATWFNQERFNDDPKTWVNGSNQRYSYTEELL